MRHVILLIALLTACSIVSPEYPRPDAVAHELEDVHVTWYQEVEDCLGIDGQISAVNLYVVPGVAAWESTFNGLSVHGEWWPPHDVYVAQLKLYSASTVKHEFEHDIRQARDWPGHPYSHCS